MKKKKKKLPEEFTCMKCNTFHKFPGYVYAHWDNELTFICDCGRVFTIFEGEAEEQ